MGKGSGRGGATDPETRQRAGKSGEDETPEHMWIEDEGTARRVDYKALLNSRIKNKKHVPVFTMNEVKRLVDEEGRVLVVIKGRVYDIKSWARSHPGGAGPLFHGAGKDMTDQFMQFHSLETHKRLASFLVATVDVKDQEARDKEGLQKDWDKLTQDLLAEGMYETNYLYFVGEACRALAFLAVCLALLLDVFGEGGAWTHLIAAVCFGMFLQQMNFIGHDLGHNGITHNVKSDMALGIVAGNLLTGVGIGWWKDSHNNHHVATNSIDGDADIQHMPFIACNPKIMDRPFFSTWHKNWHNPRGFAERYVLRFQHIIYYPAILVFARYNLYIQSWIHVYKGNSKMPRTEVVSLLGFACWVSAMVCLLPTAQERFVFVLLSHAVAGILNVQITLSHFCMEVYYGSPYSHDKGIEDQWVWTQLRTTLAIVCDPWMDWFHGGLQFQDVHHLLPRVPRHNLRAIRPRIQAICKKNGCNVSPEMTFLEANITTMKLVRQSALKAWTLEPSATSYELQKSPLFDTMFARG